MRSARLLSLLLVLQTRQRLTTAELAARLEVSTRTVLRDVAALSAAGVPVYAERGRHGGIVLLPGARLNVAHLEPVEIDALSLAGLDAAQRERLGLAAADATVARKIAARRAAAPPRALPALADLVVADNAAWHAPQPAGTDVASLALDLRAGRRLRVRYRRSGAAEAAWQVADPYGLATTAGRWYLVADVDGEGRLLNLERLAEHQVLDDAARLRAGVSLREAWAQLRARTEAPGSLLVTARLRASRVDLARRVLGSRLHEVGPAHEGWHVVRLAYREVEDVRQLLQLGDHVEVLAPDAARRRVRELAEDVAARHRP